MAPRGVIRNVYLRCRGDVLVTRKMVSSSNASFVTKKRDSIHQNANIRQLCSSSSFSSFEVEETVTSSGGQVGSSASFRHCFTQEDVNTFARLTGDCNPIHLKHDENNETGSGREKSKEGVREDEKLPEKQKEKKRFKNIFSGQVVHGALMGGLFSTLFGRVVAGSVYVSQFMRFKRPVYVGANLRVGMVVKKREEKRLGALLTCETTCYLVDDNDAVAVTGESVVLIPKE